MRNPDGNNDQQNGDADRWQLLFAVGRAAIQRSQDTRRDTTDMLRLSHASTVRLAPADATHVAPLSVHGAQCV